MFANGDFRFTPLGALPPPLGTGLTESDVRQSWSLTFRALRRTRAFGWRGGGWREGYGDEGEW